MSKTTEPKRAAVPVVDAVLKALEILDCFNTRETELSLSQMTATLGLYKSRVHRLCCTLINSGHLVRTSRSTYRLGPKLMVLGKVYEKSNSLKSIAAPLMNRLTRDTGESTALFVIDGAKAICLARAMGSSRLVFSVNEGDSIELAYTAAGRVLLAHTETDFINKVLARTKQTRIADNAKLGIEEINHELRRIRKHGYGVDDRESSEGITAIAAPIFDYENKVPAALVIVGPSFRFTKDTRQEHLEKLLEASGKISILMGES